MYPRRTRDGLDDTGNQQELKPHLATKRRPPCLGFASPHMRNHIIPKFRALAEGGAFHLSFEVVRDCLGGDCAVHALDDEVGGFGPAHEAEHQFAGEDDGAGVDLVLVGVFGGGADAADAGS